MSKKTEETTALLQDAGIPDNAIQQVMDGITGTSDLSAVLSAVGIESKEIADDNDATSDEDATVAAEAQATEEVPDKVTIVAPAASVEIPVEVSVEGLDDEAQKDLLTALVGEQFKSLAVYLKVQADTIDGMTVRLSELEKDTETVVEEKMAAHYQLDTAVWNRPTEKEDNVVDEDEKISAPTNSPNGQGGNEVMDFFEPHFGNAQS